LKMRGAGGVLLREGLLMALYVGYSKNGQALALSELVTSTQPLQQVYLSFLASMALPPVAFLAPCLLCLVLGMAARRSGAG
jgi:hypothetical protein